MDEELIQTLIINAFEARTKSYCKYSGYAVGAALLTSDGEIYRGCNVENSSYGATICAERCAALKAVSEGSNEFKAIAIVGGMKDARELKDYAYPCGVCRQVMQEFVNPAEFKIVVAYDNENFKEYTLKELFPEGFGPDNL